VRLRIAVVLLLVGGCGGSRPSELARSLEPVVAGGVPGAFVVVRDGGRTTTAAVGRIDAGERFRVGSVTKTFVATVVLQLAAERRLGLDDPVDRRVPGLLRDGDRITVRDLLAHRSGLADVADDPQVLNGPRATWSPERLIRLVDREPRTAAPGGAFRYSSTNYLVLGLIVERATGRSLAMELSRRIFAPFHLNDTAYVPGRLRGEHVHGYTLPSHQGVVDASAEPRDLDARSARWAGASGDVVSTASDLMRFYRTLLGGDLLPAPQLQAMEAVRDRYGLGLAVYSTPCGPAWGHTGNLNGVLTVAWNTRDAHRQVVVVANEYPLAAAADTALRRAAVEAFCGR
jgi:D-alanyl-D-alanine carboxypeptidase